MRVNIAEVSTTLLSTEVRCVKITHEEMDKIQIRVDAPTRVPGSPIVSVNQGDRGSWEVFIDGLVTISFTVPDWASLPASSKVTSSKESVTITISVNRSHLFAMHNDE